MTYNSDDGKNQNNKGSGTNNPYDDFNDQGRNGITVGSKQILKRLNLEVLNIKILLLMKKLADMI